MVDSLNTHLLSNDAIEHVWLIQSRLLTAHSFQKSYATGQVQPLEFTESDRIWLRIYPMKSVMRFGKKSKINPRYIGLFEILE